MGRGAGNSFLTMKPKWNTNSWQPRYCVGCFWYRHFNDFYGCWKFKCFKLSEFDQYCGRRFWTAITPENRRHYKLYM